jgi:hypothetical protein
MLQSIELGSPLLDCTEIKQKAYTGDAATHPLADEQVLGLDVAVDHVLGVAVVQRDRQVVDVSAGNRRR